MQPPAMPDSMQEQKDCDHINTLAISGITILVLTRETLRVSYEQGGAQSL